MDGFLAGIPMALAVFFLGWIYRDPLLAWLKNLKVKSGETTFEINSVQAVEQQVSANNSPTSSTSAGLATPSPTLPPAVVATSSAIVLTPNSTPAANVARAEALRNFGTSPVIIEREEEIRRDLLNVPESERQSVLIRHLAVAQLEWKAEEVYRLIFGSQLAIIEHLNLYGPESEQRLIEMFFDTAATQYPAAYERLNRDAYFLYLVNTKLVSRSEGAYTITNLGKAFLEWIPAKGILVSKAF